MILRWEKTEWSLLVATVGGLAQWEMVQLLGFAGRLKQLMKYATQRALEITRMWFKLSPNKALLADKFSAALQICRRARR